MKNIITNVLTIVKLQNEYTQLWHEKPNELAQESDHAFIENHRYNFLLWHEEDKARRDDQGAEYVYHAKRNIDRYNQCRNDNMEKIDQWCLEQFQPKQDGVPCHSETPGMMIDRLSILALKQYHMREQTERDDVDAAHVRQCEQKLRLIEQQRLQLQICLEELWAALRAGTRTFRVYYQCKMYNDPVLNPQLYQVENKSP